MEKYTKRKLRKTLESRYWVKISDEAFDVAVQGLRTFDSKPIIDDDVSPEKILEGASKLVFERFKNCAYESALYDKAYQLRWALVTTPELYMKTGPDTKSWLDQLKCERDSASVFMKEFSERWEDVLESSGGLGVLSPQCADKLSFFKDINNYASSQTSHIDEVVRFLNDIRADLIGSFSPLLTVTGSDVAEVASNLTDVPSTMILLPSHDIDHQKQKAINLTNLRVVDQQQVIREIYETLASSLRQSSSSSSTRPMGSFLLLGQSGAGKTEIAKAVAEHWYCDATRLVEIDMSDYADESVLWGRLSEVVAKRPYSVIVLDKIDKASLSVTRVLVDVLRNKAPSDVDLSNSIIFMTSSVGSDQLALFCKCHIRDEDTLKEYRRNREKFRKTHDCTLKGSGPERALIEAKKHLNGDVLDSVDKVLVVKRGNYRAVFRVLLREIVRDLIGQRLVVYASDALLYFLMRKNVDRYNEERGHFLKRLLLEHVIKWLPVGQDLNNVVVHVDRPELGSSRVWFSFRRREQSVDDCYFDQQDGTFDKSIANLRTKVESVCRISKLMREYLGGLLESNECSPDQLLVGNICNEILKWAPRVIDRTDPCGLSSCERKQRDRMKNVQELRKRMRFLENEREKNKQRIELQSLRTTSAAVLAGLLFIAYVLLLNYTNT
ncbi:chaperone protein clpb 1 [Phtheirospermum japonicum]|uniref:Chaperone protein clpb 1 n=1 Tax=Phtheirospermum japonicum TaxID=374723 RepID=A0A830CPM9_9LAMI|nr:chaperone protein clpb 1 [Phtheirospermum japonicum]